MKPLVLRHKNKILIFIGLIILVVFIGISTELLVSDIYVDGNISLISAFAG